jgi:hypothetical protein
MIEFTLEELEIIQTGMSLYEKRNYNFRGDMPYETPITPILRKLKIMIEDATPIEKPELIHSFETLKKVLNAEIPITVKQSCHHAFKIKCEHCEEMITIETRGSGW